MNQFVKIWRGSMPRLAFAGLLAIASVGVQAQVNNNNGVAGSPILPLPITGAGDYNLSWSRAASQAFALSQLTGDFYDRRVTTTETTPTGFPVTYLNFSKTLKSLAPTRDLAGNLKSDTMGNALTWVAQPDDTVFMAGGTFELSNIHWDLSDTGSANVWATASGTGIGSTDLLAFSVPAGSLTRTPFTVSFGNLVMSSTALDLMTQAFGADPTGLAYSSLRAAMSKMGSVNVSPVPELSSWSQLSLGLLGLSGLALRRRTTARR